MTDGPGMDAVELEVVRHALAGVAEEMGAALRRAAYSPNIKERVDCSAAVFDPDGRMVAQAEHIPVHLGSMPASVAAALDAFGPLAPGDQVALNDPYRGGTHLPDLTVVAAVGDDTDAAGGHLLGYVANRAHHADVGGAAPGSMPADAVDVAMEGVRVPPVRIGDAAGMRDDVLELIAANSRTPAERRGDLRAQLAANHVGARRLRELAAARGSRGLARAMAEVRAYSDRRVRAAVREIPDGTYTFTDVLEVDAPPLTRTSESRAAPEGEAGTSESRAAPEGEAGTSESGEGEVGPGEVPIRVEVTVAGDRVTADFAGSALQVAAPINAVRAVTLSSAYFVFRMLTDPDAPPNDGCYDALEVRTPAGSVVDAAFPAPVAAGNVETSQRIVDVLLGAFAQAVADGVPAASQGTMNNLLLGAASPGFSYYETLGGGEGGTPFRAGMHGVHTGMTNTKNTPAEAMELAYPLRVRCYELRQGSGGVGAHPGGEGLVREVEVTTDATLTLQTERRARGPWGLAGGDDGAPGRNTIVRADGSEEQLPAKGTWTLHAGDRVRVETPGAGGWGPA
ncbi:hydantoinase B/oxoprolinase family protein [Egibacter rhizosphaerae]|uniref:Hydantoinase B/oxoprolinase family protein n=1 Tax=Egibacter rhizosphaerae TaxID=1670831 RepID=A0A411YIW1_9ACTN|nr:hydantoinase B/oxoprolinase family protein [Egibacter rhizosphaerae]QBI21016.1 hydantoinase B/oxoprolinase family protein [Egibacter rhizosphaerae]